MKRGGTWNRIFLIGILSLSFNTWANSSVLAVDSQVQVLVGDVCPNIPGNQPTLPHGMQLDDDDNCFTPTPPPPPDACPNLNDHQAAIPVGYYRNQSGNCVSQTRPPRDVCPNLTDTQTEVPYGMQTVENSDCVWPPTDVCSNIPGPQGTLPDKMKLSDTNECYTPNVTTPTKPSQPQLREELAQNNPLPFYIIAALGFVVLLLLVQTIREAFATRDIIILFKLRKDESATLDQIILLIIPFLTSTFAAMIIDRKEPLLSALRKAQSNLESISGQPSETFNSDHTAFSRVGIHVKTLHSPLFLIPTVLTILITIIANVAFNSTGPSSGFYVGLQIFSLLMIVCMLFFVLRTRHIRHIQHDHVEQLIKQSAIHDASNKDLLHNLSLLLDMELHTIGQMDQATLDDQLKKYLGQLITVSQKLHLLYTYPKSSDNPADTYRELEKTLRRYVENITPSPT